MVLLMSHEPHRFCNPYSSTFLLSAKGSLLLLHPIDSQFPIFQPTNPRSFFSLVCKRQPLFSVPFLVPLAGFGQVPEGNGLTLQAGTNSEVRLRNLSHSPSRNTWLSNPFFPAATSILRLSSQVSSVQPLAKLLPKNSAQTTQPSASALK